MRAEDRRHRHRRRRRPGARAATGALLAAASGLAAAAPPLLADSADPFSDCVEQVRARPEVYEPYLCFHSTASATGRWREAEDRLARLGEELEFDGWALLLRGHLTQLRDEPRALGFYRRSADAFAARGLARGEILARHNLRNMLHRRGEAAAAAAEVASALAVAEASGEPALVAQALVIEGTHLVETGGDLARAHRGLRRALALLPADATYPQRKLALLALANVSYQLARFDEAAETYGRLLALTRANQDAIEEATTLFNIANARQRQLEEQPAPEAVATLEPLALAASTAARRAGNRLVEVRSAALLAQLERARGERGAARRRLEEALATARRLGHPERVMICLWLLAELAADDDPAEAQDRSAEAAALALATGNDRHLAYAWQSRMRVDWQTRPRAEAVATSLRALGAIEALAAQQSEEASTVGLFGAWARDYRWVAGQMLVSDPPDLDGAFAVMERMRARALLAALAATDEGGDRAADRPAAREQAARRALIAVQRRLLAPGPGEERGALLAQLEERELELAAARAARGGTVGGIAPSAFAELAELRAGLGPGEALLLYQLASWSDLYGDFAGGSWVLAVTAGGATVHRLPDRAAIEPLVPMLLALVERRDGSDAAAATRLWDLLLAAPLAALPAGTERLVIAPDGALFSLPFELLRPGNGPGREPLGVRYEVALVPSATALLRWRGTVPTPARRSVLVLADPVLPGASAVAASVRDAALGEDLALGRLPEARREGELLARLLAPTSELLSAGAATERALARPDLGDFAVLHLAAHAISDGVHPQRSAVLLAAADATEDGLLQGREIARLPLAGRLVVLSACRTAAGAVAAGEGPLSLARAFQQAGARGVVASRWALRDDEAAEMVGIFYRHLASGRRLGAALRAARREAWAEGRPAAAWAALVLMGEPDAGVLDGLPIAGPRSGRATAAWALAIGGGLVLLALVLGRRRARRRAPAG